MKIKLIIITVIAIIGSAFYSNGIQAQEKSKSKSTKKSTAMSHEDWPAASKKAADEMIAKYGQPDGRTSDMLVWYNNGIWLKTVVYKMEMKHDFPMSHTDVLEQWINYRVPLDKYNDLARYDGSVTVNRTNGTISARCDMESMNILALNLSYDIINNVKSLAQARDEYGKNAMAFKKGDKPAYTQKLNFSSDKSAPDPDKPLDMEMEKTIGAEGTGK